MNKNNLDQYFRKKFSDFKETPDSLVWESIENTLDQKKKRKKIIPFWWKLAGIAAALALLIYSVTLISDAPPILDNEPMLTDVEKKDEEPNINSEDKLVKENPVISGEAQAVTNAKNAENVEQEAGFEESVTKQPSYTANTRKTSEEALYTNTLQEREAQNLATALEISKDNTKVAADRVDKKNIVTGREQNVSGVAPQNSEKSTVFEQPDSNIIEDAKIAQVEENKAKEEDPSQGKKSIFDEISELEADDLEVTENSTKWSVGPSIAPVYFNSLGEGSSIDADLVSNSKSGNVTLSYGLGVAYQISNKLSIRSGIHKVEYEYQTDDISFSPSFEGTNQASFSNINYTAPSENIVVESNKNGNFVAPAAPLDINAKTASRQGSLGQTFGYIEVPVELNYALVAKRFGIDLVGGVSSLFLTDNAVILESEGISTEIGEANNINSVNFSTNIGLGINYQLSPSLRLNVEPMFKYQLNTFSNTSGNFQPFSLGVYSGLNFSF